MKKIALVLAVLLCALPMMAFAEIAVTGSVSFSLGNTEANDDTLPVFASAKSATATVSVASDDEKVVASVGLDLLPAVTSTYNYGANNAYAPTYDSSLAAANAITKYVAGYSDYLMVKALVDFWNDNDTSKTYLSSNATPIYAFGADDAALAAIKAGLLAALNNASALVDVAYLNADGDLTVKGAEEVDAPAASVTAGEEFVWTDAIGAAMSGIYSAGDTYMGIQFNAAIAKICDEATSAAIKALATGSAVAAYINGLTAETYKALDKTDAKVLETAADLLSAWDNVSTPSNGDPTVTSAINYITSASLAFKDVAGVLDITFNLAGTHVGAGAIMADGAGHTSDAIAGYPSLMVGLSSGVVEGLNAGVTFYIDDNDAGDDVSEDYFTWVYDVDANDPVYGLGVCGGYTMAMDDMTVGASVTFGMYDLMGDKNWAFSVAPSFSGFGANLGVQFDYGMELMYVAVMADYTIMGITPNVAFYYADASGVDNVLAYNGSPANVMATFKDGSDGMLLAGGLSVDLTELVGMGISVSGGAEYGLSGAAASELAWNAGLSVGGLVEGLTIGFDCNADSVYGSTFDYAVSASYAYSIATLSASLGSAYDADDDDTYVSWSLGTSVSF